MLVGWLARMASSASMPSTGEIGSSALKVSDLATPMSDHWPQLIVVAGRPEARRQSTRPSSQALAAAYAPCPGAPSSEEVDEKPTHPSSCAPLSPEVTE